MTGPVDRTVAHGGTRHGETVPITVTELRHCDELRAMETRLLAVVAAARLLDDVAITLDVLLNAIDGKS